MTKNETDATLKYWLVLGARAGGRLCSAPVAQSNGVPGPTDYATFSRFITDRNIFDPNRYAAFLFADATGRGPHARAHCGPGVHAGRHDEL